MTHTLGAAYRPDPRHQTLGEEFFDVVDAAPFPRHDLRYRNDRWAERIGLGALDDDAWIRHFSRFESLPDNLEAPLALRYHGHQFQTYNPNLGDGRGFLFAQLRDDEGRLLDLGTKGSGQTPWSRGADGRLTLKGGVREVLATAMLEALGVYTSKSFSLIETGEELTRGDEPSPTRSSVLVRLSHSHIRFGSFQRQAALQKPENVERLLAYSIAEYFPGLGEVAAPDRPAAFLRRVAEASADLAASWMAAGFVHGVLNTDNLNITGESFDYGPYRFLPVLDPHFTAAYFDHTSLYAYGRQPEIVAWNLARLAEALLAVSEKDALVAVLRRYESMFTAAYRRHTMRRLGIRPRPENADTFDDDDAFVKSVYHFLLTSQTAFEQFFFDWYGGPASEERATRSPAAAAYRSAEFRAVAQGFDRYEPTNPDALAGPYFQREGPCTLLIDEIESLWDSIASDDDWRPFADKLIEIDGMRVVLGVC